MAEDRATRQIGGEGTGSLSYTLAPGLEQYVESVLVEVDTSAAGDTTALLEVATPDGIVMARREQGRVIPGGGSGSATFALGLDDEGGSTAVSGIRFDFDNEGGWLYVQTNNGVDIDTMPDPLAEGGTWGTVLEDGSGNGVLIGSDGGETKIKGRGGAVTLLADGVPSPASLNLSVNSADAFVRLGATGDTFQVLDHLGDPLVTFTG